MKKLLFVVGVMTAVAVSGQNFRSASFLNDNVGPIVSGTSVTYGGITISNAAAAPFGGFTNLLSYGYNGIQATNPYILSWTNTGNQVWVIPTNQPPTNASGIYTNPTGIYFAGIVDYTTLAKDVTLWSTPQGTLPVTVTTNTWVGDASAYPASDMILCCRFWGAASAATKMNLIFVGVPDGVNEPSATTTTAVPPAFEWGIVPSSGTSVVVTNFPIWKFAGCKAVRLRSATLTTTTAANIGVTIQSLTLNGFVP